MSTLKTERGTILYVAAVFDGPTGTGQSYLLPVLNMQIAGLKPTAFMMENSGDVEFGGLIPDMNQATLRSCSLVISYPDGTFATTSPITIGTIIVVGWSDQLINAFGPPTDPDWRNNPSYITMTQQFSLQADGAKTKPKALAAPATPTHPRRKKSTRAR